MGAGLGWHGSRHVSARRPHVEACRERVPELDADRLGTVLSIWAHPDDETYLAGGVMASCVAAGQRVRVRVGDRR